MGAEVLVGRYLLPGTGASFKNASRAQKRTTVNSVVCARVYSLVCSDAAASGNVGICSYLFESVMQLSMGRAARVCSPGTSGQHFSRARITICSIRSRQSLKLFDARGLSMRLRRPRDPTRTYRQLVPETMHASHRPNLLIMNIVFYDPAFSFLSISFLLFSLFFSFSLSLSLFLFFVFSLLDRDHVYHGWITSVFSMVL